MLQSFREQIKGWVATVIIGLLIIPFALWGVNSYFQYGDGGDWVAQIDGEAITVGEFRNEYQQQLSRFQQMLGEQYRPELFDTPSTREQVLEGMVDRALLEVRTREAGYRVGNAELASEIMAMEAFQVEGKFDRQVMRDRLAQIRMSESTFYARLRSDKALSQLPEAIRNSEFVLPAEVERGVALLEEKRTATWLAVPAVKFLPQITITDADIEQHYQAEQARFMTEESVVLEYIELDAETMPAGAAEPTEAELADLYAQEEERFKQPEQRRARHILVDDEATALAVKARLDQGEDFAKLAAELSKDGGSAENGGDLGLVAKGVMVGPFDDAMFSMKPDEVRGPVKTEFGYHLIQLMEVQAGTNVPLAAVRDQLVSEWRLREGGERFARAGEQLADLVYANPDSLQPAADALGLKIQRTAGVTRSGGGDVATEQRVRDAAFSPEVLVEKRNSGVIELDEGHVTVVRVAEHQPSALRPLAEVRDEVINTLRETRAGEMAQAKADEIAVAMRGGAQAEDIAKRESLPQPMSRTIARNGRDAPAEVAKALFDAPRPSGAPVVGVTKLGAADRMVFRIDQVTPGDFAGLGEAERSSRRDALAQRQASLAQAAYSESLQRAADVKLQPEKTR
jgi:peptidyl-prolyl cis-trans isomerase D